MQLWISSFSDNIVNEEKRGDEHNRPHFVAGQWAHSAYQFPLSMCTTCPVISDKWLEEIREIGEGVQNRVGVDIDGREFVLLQTDGILGHRAGKLGHHPIFWICRFLGHHSEKLGHRPLHVIKHIDHETHTKHA